MTHRQRFFAVLENRGPDRVPFFPDITDWYKARRTGKGEPQPFATGQLIPDDHPIHRNPGDMPERFREYTLLDFHRRHDWGCPIHAYEALVVSQREVTVRTEHTDGFEHRLVETPVGTLDTTFGMAPYGSQSIVRYPLQSPDDLAAYEFWVGDTSYSGDAAAVQGMLEALGEMGVTDLPIGRTPFGLLVQEHMGYEAVAYALADEPALIHRLMDALAPGFWQRVEAAASLPGRIVIITDHADEHLISPRWFRDYCLPFYREACQRLHRSGKLVSAHLDGNIRGLIPLLPETGFDLLDGCTPAPMGNYEVEDLAPILGPHLKAYCGVPSTLFCTHTPVADILAYGRRVIEKLSPNVILNIGDVLPPDGDIDQVIALGQVVLSS